MRFVNAHAARILGRRGGILVLFGLAWICCGIGFATIQTDRFSRSGPGGPIEFMDTTPWPGVFWVVCGLIALVNGFLRRRLRNEDAVGYGALIMPPTLWVLAYIWSYLLWLFTRNDPQVYGRETGFLGALIFLVIVVIIRIVANWPDDLDVVHPPPPGPASDQEMVILARLEYAREEGERLHREARGETAVQRSDDETDGQT